MSLDSRSHPYVLSAPSADVHTSVSPGVDVERHWPREDFFPHFTMALTAALRIISAQIDGRLRGLTGGQQK
jgi:hypothetical protein